MNRIRSEYAIVILAIGCFGFCCGGFFTLMLAVLDFDTHRRYRWIDDQRTTVEKATVLDTWETVSRQTRRHVVQYRVGGDDPVEGKQSFLRDPKLAAGSAIDVWRLGEETAIVGSARRFYPGALPCVAVPLGSLVLIIWMLARGDLRPIRKNVLEPAQTLSRISTGTALRRPRPERSGETGH